MKVLTMLLAASLPLLADWKTEVDPAELGPQPRLAAQEFHYRLSWKGMLNAGNLTFTFGRPDPRFPSDYHARAIGGSSGLASKLFPYKIDLNSRLDPATLRPRSFIGIQNEGDEINTTRSRWSGNLVRIEQITRIPKNGKEGSRTSEFRFTPVHDAFSAMLHVRSHRLADGERLTLPILPFNKPYLLRVHVLGRTRFAGRDTIKLELALQKIDTKTLALMPYKKMKRTTLWLSDDANRIPVELRAEIYIGDVRMTLTGHRKL
jgi:hypothetical protein